MSSSVDYVDQRRSKANERLLYAVLAFQLDHAVLAFQLDLRGLPESVE